MYCIPIIICIIEYKLVSNQGCIHQKFRNFGMVLFLMLLSSCLMHGSTAPDKKKSDIFAGSVSTHVDDFDVQERVIQLVAIIIKHNQPLRNKSGKLIYSELTNYEKVIEKLRRINHGFLPIFASAKNEIISFLISNPSKTDALHELDALAKSFDLHPLSVEKIKNAVIEEYEKNDKRVQEFRAFTLLPGGASSVPDSSCLPKTVHAQEGSIKRAVDVVIGSTYTKPRLANNVPASSGGAIAVDARVGSVIESVAAVIAPTNTNTNAKKRKINSLKP